MKKNQASCISVIKVKLVYLLIGIIKGVMLVRNAQHITHRKQIHILFIKNDKDMLNKIMPNAERDRMRIIRCTEILFEVNLLNCINFYLVSTEFF